MEFLIITLLFAVAVSPIFYGLVKGTAKSKKISLIANVASVAAVVLGCTVFAFTNSAAAAETAAAAATDVSFANGMAFIGAAIVTGLSCLGGGIAIASAASAAIGAISENDKIFGKALIIVVLAEGIAIYGMLVSILILGSVK